MPETGSKLSPVPTAEPSGNLSSSTEGASLGVAPQELWQLMERQVALFTGTDSTSIPVERARELMESVLFCVQTARKEQLATGQLPLAEQLLAGQRILTQRRQEGLRLQKRAEAQLLPLDNAVYREVLQETAQFFRWYDIRFLAQQIPCMIDYPLAQPVGDERLGVDYINEYLRRRICEDSFCALFAPKALRATLLRAHADYAELPLNLFEPVFHCALGQALLGADTITLIPGQQDAATLREMFFRCDATDAEARVLEACTRLCTRLRIWDSARRHYLAACARALVPRLCAADANGVANLFGCG